ncbi:F-box protein [Citrus sinensis]|uniref:F-box protein At2g02240-like n=1 Tax=Citrus sinensis TaxID=2711 RepID=UPI0007639D3E|nr:F-box protein At2g02240-like [Citrus sinensis]KAH9670954.1 F-box protein [Citrus sinensis]
MEAEMGLLPEGCIANVISLTTPRDACRLSSVSTVFKSAAESDAVWERFLPPDYPTLLSDAASSSSSSSSLHFSSKKELYFSLCHNPILIDEGKKSFSLDKRSGKKCYMISARDLLIVWGDTPTYWRWTSVPEARFPEVAELICVCWLEIRCKINTRSLSPRTLYAAYLVYKPTAGSYGFEYQPVDASVGVVGSESQTRTVYLDAERGQRQRYHYPRRIGLFNRSRRQASMPKENDGCYPKERDDEWLEIELGDFLNKEDEDGELEMSVLEVAAGDWKGGLIIQGIEIRPKQGK